MSEWISIEDRLPENDKEVLALLKSGAVDIGRVETENCYQCSTKSKELITRALYGVITHWMPLPKAPKQEGPFKMVYSNGRFFICHSRYGINDVLSHDLRLEKTVEKLARWLNSLWNETQTDSP